MHASRRLAPALLGMWLAAAACSRDAAPAPAGTPVESPARWACQVDTDCINSCSLGAVSAQWYADAGARECNDGCAGQLAQAPRCLEGTCVAFRIAPGRKLAIRDDGCTHK